jgi:hypothetical protein
MGGERQGATGRGAGSVEGRAGYGSIARQIAGWLKQADIEEGYLEESESRC